MLKPAASMLALLAVLASPAAIAQPAAAPAPAPAAPAASEDARLAAFFQETFMEALRESPEALTQLGMKERYSELGDYTDAGARKNFDMAEAQLARMKREFDPARLSPASRLSYKLFEDGIVRGRDLFRFRFQQYAATSTGTAISGIPGDADQQPPCRQRRRRRGLYRAPEGGGAGGRRGGGRSRPSHRAGPDLTQLRLPARHPRHPEAAGGGALRRRRRPRHLGRLQEEGRGPAGRPGDQGPAAGRRPRRPDRRIQARRPEGAGLAGAHGGQG